MWCDFGFGKSVRSVVVRCNIGYLFTRVCVVALKASVCVCVVACKSVCVCVLNSSGKILHVMREWM